MVIHVARAAVVLVFALSCASALVLRKRSRPPLRRWRKPDQDQVPGGPPHIRHVVVLMMENRSFDHFLGWVPGADGKQAGLAYPDAVGGLHSTHELAPDFQGCLFRDPDHSYSGGRIEYDDGRNDGWLRASDEYSIGYYTQPDLAFLGKAVPQWTTFDRYHPSILSETFPNRIYQHAGQTDRISNTFEPSALPTVWDRLAQKGLRGRYYYSDLPFLALWERSTSASAR